MLEVILLGILAIAFGALLYLKPVLIWTLTEKWKFYADTEPSDLYIKSTKFGGIFSAAVGLFLIVAPFIWK